MLHIIILLLSGSFVSSEHLGLDEGSDCFWGNATGRCVSIFKCLSSFLDLKEKTFPPICSFHGKTPIICCTDCELVDDTRKIIVDDRFGLLNLTGRKSEDACTKYAHSIWTIPCRFYRPPIFYLGRDYDPGRYCWDVKLKEIDNSNAAFGGRSSERAEFPHMALLGYGPDWDSAQWLCGGSIISEWFILTAGHCLSQPQLGEVKYLGLGILRRSDPPGYWANYVVKRRVRHPEYTPPSQYNDIALLETKEKIIFGLNVVPACLHTSGEAIEILSSTGWGALGYKKQLADTLQEVIINRYEEHECLQHYPSHRLLESGYNHTTQMCYGGRESLANTCQGDSGGPLQSKKYDKLNCMFTILGVTSAGKPCGIKVGPGLYTRVYPFVPWIESIVWP